MVLYRAGACLAVALILAPARHGSAWSSPQSPPADTQPQAAPVAQSQREPKSQADSTPPQTRRQDRRKRAPRTPARRPSSRMSRLAEPTRHDLTLTAIVLGGYDDNPGAGAGAHLAPAAIASGSTGYLDGALEYFGGNTLRSIRIGSTGNVHAYPGYLERPAAGGAATVDAMTTVGRNLTFRATERVGYESLFNVFSPGASSRPSPPGIGETVPATGLFERHSLSSYTLVSIGRLWSRRDSTSFSYSYGVQQFTDDDYGNNNSHDVLAEYRRRLAQGVGARAEYRYVNGEYTEHDGAVRLTSEHRIEGGPEIEKALSRRRHLTLWLGAGASHIESAGSTGREPCHSWVPVGSGSVTLGLSPLWSVGAGYRRGFSPLRGVTDEVYTTDTAFLTIRRPVTDRTDLRVGAMYSNWNASLAPGVDDRFRVYGASLQVNVALTATLAATADYSYYRHRYSNRGELPAGFSAKYDRHAFRVGLKVRVPLAGTPSRRR